MTRGLAISIVLAAAIAGGCVMLFNRFTLVNAHTNTVSGGSLASRIRSSWARSWTRLRVGRLADYVDRPRPFSHQ